MYVTYVKSKEDGYHVYVTYIKSKEDTMCMLHISRVRRIPCVCYIYQE